MSLPHLILSGLRHHWRMHFAVGLGVVAATAVLTGALLVGDSVRGSLRQLAVERLGRISEALVSEQFFRAALTDELAADEQFAAHFSDAVPAILLEGAVERPGGGRAGRVTVVGAEEPFWELGSGEPIAPQRDAIVLNGPLADDLGAAVGDEVVLRVPLPGDIPADTLLGEKSDTVRGRRLRVAAVIAASGLGRFGLRPSQQLPRNAFVATATLQSLLDRPGGVNAIFVGSETATEGSSPEASAALARALRPSLADYGLRVRHVVVGAAERPATDYFDLTGEQMLLPKAIVDALAGDDRLQPALTYLANTLTAPGPDGTPRKIPYSTVTGIESTAELGPLFDAQGAPLAIADDEIVLNDWAADDLGVRPGDPITLTYYEPESTHGTLVEAPPLTLRLAAIVPLADAEGRPTAARDPDLVPELKGVTDQETIGDWELPFALVEEIRSRDDDYWETYRATPKAFVSLATARRLWSSRFGDTTSIRLAAQAGVDASTLAALVDLPPAELGLAFRPVKRQALEAARGTTPFDALFLGFSFFIVAAAVMLTSLLFRLGVEQRAAQIGALAAVGWPRRRIARLLAGEGLVVAAIGAALGLLVGVAYAWLMLAGLRTWWLAAVSTPFLRLFVTPTALLAGYAIGVVVSLLTIVWSLRRMARLPVRRLLAGQAGEESVVAGRRGGALVWAARGMLVAAVAIALLATGLGGEAQAGAFFAAGGLVLMGGLLAIWLRLRGPAADDGGAPPTLARLAARNAARSPGRSALTIGLVAAASFLIVAIGAFRLETSDEGTGGFDLVAESAAPLYFTPDTEQGRFELAFGADDGRLVASARTFAVRVREGDDASCLNLYRPRQPRVLGLPAEFLERGGFAWSATGGGDGAGDNPWRLLDEPTDSGAVPVAVDAATATYSLQKGIGDHLALDDGRGATVDVEIVALLKNSLFQGDLLMSERAMLARFPETSGYRYFLVDAGDPPAAWPEEVRAKIADLERQLDELRGEPKSEASAARMSTITDDIAKRRAWLTDRDARAAAIGQALERTLGDQGLDAVTARSRLAGFLAVQNTYLSTFQSLGGLGLLLGTFGLATVQLRNVFERRGELALLRAAGFRRARLAALVMLENGVLLAGGLALGVAAALVAVLPHWWLGGAAPPTAALAGLLAVVLIVGLLAGLAAVRVVLRAPLLAALRGD